MLPCVLTVVSCFGVSFLFIAVARLEPDSAMFCSRALLNKMTLLTNVSFCQRSQQLERETVKRSGSALGD